MAEHRRIWPLLVYGGLAAIAAVGRKKPERTPENASYEAVRKPYRTTYPAPDQSSEIRGEASPATPGDPDKRPREHFENDQPISAQLSRAKEQGRGRHAVAPWHIPWAGWKDILWRVYASVNDNRLLAVAAGVVFYSLLAIFPAIAAFVSLYGLIADASTIDSHLSLAAGIFPAGAVDILHEQITRLTAKSDAKLSLGFITGLAVALWSANAGMKAIIDALNVVYDEKEKRSFVKLNLLSLLFTLIAILSLMIALAAVVIAPMVFSAVGLSSLWSPRHRCSPVAVAAGPGGDRVGRDLSLWAEPRRGALAMAFGRERGRSRRVADHVGALLLVHCPFRRIQRHLWVAWSRRRHDDVDVDLSHRDLARRRTQRRDRASDRQGFNGGLGEAAWRARCGDGRHNRGGALALPVPPNQEYVGLLASSILRFAMQVVDTCAEAVNPQRQIAQALASSMVDLIGERR
jgi:hypothetical protein